MRTISRRGAFTPLLLSKAHLL
ncbi:hypothetical protein OIU76_019897 [Salix suchowensis]|nr:hypothetical protein OIU76_019897 [Salix suchowensis]KAJ6314910.1 hypothetical protein OIU78_018404 [Salix suchowensis]